MSIEGVLFRIIDTAGLRKTSDVVEKLGIDRSYKKAAESSIVILLGDGSKLSEGALRTEANMLQERITDHTKVVPMMNKSDINSSTSTSDVLSISALTGEGLDALKQVLLDHVRSLQSGTGDIVVTNARHVDALSKARTALEEAKKAIDTGISGELLAIDLRRAQHHLGEITGRITTDDLLGSIFGRFCIGK